MGTLRWNFNHAETVRRLGIHRQPINIQTPDRRVDMLFDDAELLPNIKFSLGTKVMRDDSFGFGVGGEGSC